MNFPKTLFTALLLAVATSIPASAQQTDGKSSRSDYPYMFVGVQGGIQTTFTNYPARKLITPIGAFNVGGMFTPAIGARVNVSGWKEKGGLAAIDQTYDYKFVNTNLDLMLNLCNLFAPNKSHALNAYLIGGAGFGYAWDNDALAPELLQVAEKNINFRWSDDRFVHSFRVGMQLEAELGRHVGLNLEVTANNLQDRFNSKLNGKGDWQLQAMLGLNFKFGRKKKAVVQPAPEPVQPEYVETTPPAPVVEPCPEPEVEATPSVRVETKRIEVFYAINSATPSAAEEAKLRDLAEWMKEHPEAKVELVGYADAGTGSAEVNRRISKRRADRAAKLLVEKYGIEASRVSTDYKGDSVQPFSENNANRVVIGIGTQE